MRLLLTPGKTMGWKRHVLLERTCLASDAAERVTMWTQHRVQPNWGELVWMWEKKKRANRVINGTEPNSHCLQFENLRSCPKLENQGMLHKCYWVMELNAWHRWDDSSKRLRLWVGTRERRENTFSIIM